jgi:hypothetical protein
MTTIAISLAFSAFSAAAQESQAPLGGTELAALSPAVPQSRVPTVADIDALTLDSDFAPFMHPSCAEEVRLGAMRRLWTLLPTAELAENSAI